MKRLVMCALLASGCGLPLPTEGATDCGSKTYLEAGVDPRLTCDVALSLVRDAQQETGVDVVREANIVEFMRGNDLGELGYPQAWGRTQDGDVAVVGSHGNTIIHEALHLRYGYNHCDWSVKYLPILERNYVGGSFDDDCQHVHCTTTHAWQDSTGQFYGNMYVCTPIP